VQRLARLDARGELPSAADWRRAQPDLQRTLELDPHNPAHSETLARWYERYTLRLSSTSSLAPAYLEQAAAHLRRTLVARPGSPYTWANLALVKLRLEQFDAEFQTAVENAWRLGPWEPEVQLTLAQIAFRAQDRLDPRARDATRSAIQNALRRYDRELFDMARRYGALSLLCDLPRVSASPLATACI
jgi:Tfp pilus assembly protein PilF